jgi:hypothetical protein
MRRALPWILALLAGCGEGKPPSEPRGAAMTEDRFWQLMEESRTRAKAVSRTEKPDFSDRHEPALQAVLEGLSAEDVAEFDSWFRRLSLKAYRWDLWAAAYWIGGGCSDDGFMDFRSNLVSLGKDAYTAILADPNALADVVGGPDTPFMQAEGIGYIATKVYRKKTGKEPPDDPTRKYPKDPAGQDFDFDDEAEMRKRLPKLTSKIKSGGD